MNKLIKKLGHLVQGMAKNNKGMNDNKGVVNAIPSNSYSKSHSSFFILHSSFKALSHSSSFILHSSFKALSHSSFFILHSSLVLLFTSCARMGNPDGGWYDETPPRVIGASPADRGTNANSRKINIYFNEYVKVDNATEKVVVSPPQMEMPEIKTKGKYISVQLKDTLQANTTYTVDFSDAITDNNEGNPLGNYTYSFSTGDEIDTLEVSGTVLTAENLEPVKGILVGLYALTDSTAKVQMPVMIRQDSIQSETFVRVSRTDSRGHFVIRGIAPGRYTIGALKDMDGNYRFSTLGEDVAFTEQTYSPSVFEDIRQDTIWADALHIKDIMRVKYNHYLPDNIVLRTFTHETNERHYLKYERKDADRFTLFFTAPVQNDTASLARLAMDYEAARLPEVRGLNFNADGAFAIEPSQKGDTITYWLRDTALVNQDTLNIELRYLATDSLGMLAMQTDTVEVLAKIPYAKRLKLKEQEQKEWEKKIEKKRKRLQDGEELTDTIMPEQRLTPKFDFQQSIRPDATLSIEFPAPMKKVDMKAVHLYVQQDSLWYRAPFSFLPQQAEDAIMTDSLPRSWQLASEWIEGAEYSLEIDTLAFEDIYGHTSEPHKTGLQVRRNDEFGSLFVNVQYNAPTPSAGGDDKQQILVQLLDSSDKPVRTEKVQNGTAEFYYLTSGKYYMRAIVDRNGNGKWDTGNYLTGTQPEEVYYYNGMIEAKAKWDLTKEWNLTATPLDRQKPDEIKKQKADAEKKIQNRNAQRAAAKGIPVPTNLKY